MWRTARLIVLGLMAATLGGELASAQQPPIKRTDLLKSDLAEINGSEMNVWVADLAPGAATGRHTHPTPRFVYVVEGAVVLELEGKPPQTFKAGQAFAETPGVVHNFRNASAREPAKALGFQYGPKGQALQANAP
jgi:quercetin dioxygenase-like cupin family protein